MVTARYSTWDSTFETFTAFYGVGHYDTMDQPNTVLAFMERAQRNRSCIIYTLWLAGSS